MLKCDPTNAAPFGAVLSEAETRAAIAWVQSRWSDAVYRAWRRKCAGHSH